MSWCLFPLSLPSFQDPVWVVPPVFKPVPTVGVRIHLPASQAQAPWPYSRQGYDTGGGGGTRETKWDMTSALAPEGIQPS